MARRPATHPRGLTERGFIVSRSSGEPGGNVAGPIAPVIRAFRSAARRAVGSQGVLANARQDFAQARHVRAHCFIASSSLNFPHSTAQRSHIVAHASADCAPAGPKHAWMHAEQDDAQAEQSSRHFRYSLWPSARCCAQWWMCRAHSIRHSAQERAHRSASLDPCPECSAAFNRPAAPRLIVTAPSFWRS